MLMCAILPIEIAVAKMPTSVKQSTVRSENTAGGKEQLVIPYAFSSETMGLTFGIGGLVKGYGQDQLSFAATIFSAIDDLEQEDDAIGVIGGMWDFKIPYTRRLFISATASTGYYPLKRAYSAPAFDPDIPRPGSNDSMADQYVEVGGTDNWFDIRLEYVLPIGAAESQAMMSYELKNGMLTSKPTGGKIWNPFSTGVTNILFRTYSRYQEYEFDPDDLQRTIHPFQLAISYDNTDFPTNPSYGSSQFIGVSHDFAMLESNQTWTFWEFEAAKYYSLGKTDWARQRVLAFDAWTGDTPTWTETTLENGFTEVNNAPPYYEGATLGGFYRMRAYPFYRFNDRSAIYTSAEYRYTPDCNPIGEIRWLRFLKMDWWQLVAFIEGGRVAREYTLSELTSDWKADVGIGIRALVAGCVARFDVAGSDEGASVWIMVGYPF
jgi:outer membrane protein assembly factor BamA